MGLNVTPVSYRLERGVGVGGCLLMAVPLALAAKGVVLWLGFGWWHVGILLSVLSLGAFVKLSRAFATWDARFIDFRGRRLRLGRLNRGREIVDCELSCDDLTSVGLLKKSTHGAAYGLAAFLRADTQVGPDLERNGRIGDGYDLFWWTTEYAGTVRKLLSQLEFQGVPCGDEYEIEPTGRVA